MCGLLALGPVSPTQAAAPDQTATATASATKPAPADTVILLHGLGRSPLAMARLERDLRAEGYIVRNLAYASQRDDIATLQLKEFRQQARQQGLADLRAC